MSDFLVNEKSGEYFFREDLVKKYGRKKIFKLIANGVLMDEDLYTKKQNKRRIKKNDNINLLPLRDLWKT